MKFVVETEIFQELPTVCFAVVMARGVDNSRPCAEITAMLQRSVEQAAARFAGKKVKEEPEILPYREAFRALGINPSRHLCSIEALFTRIAKGKGVPSINPIVDLGNAISLKYTLPLGAHDMGQGRQEMHVRVTRAGDHFLPFGGTELEQPEPGEVVYAVGDEVRTRRWTWRQSEQGKITEATRDVFFPIDGFTDHNLEHLLAAQRELAQTLQTLFSCDIRTGFLDAGHPEITL